MDKYDIGVVGLWYGLNYGSILTYYALYNIIDSMGYKAIMVNKPVEMWSPRYTEPDTIANKFINKHCNVSEIKEPYHRWSELNDICEGFVVGSDVVWNYQICGSQSGQFFFLDFADKSKKKIAMASSFGSGYDAPERERIISQAYLKEFDYIGVREKEGIDLCMEKFGVKADMVMDPVFICPKHVYQNLANDSKVEEKEKFITTYLLGPSLAKKKIVQDIADKLNLQLRNMPNPNNPGRIKEVTGFSTVKEPSVPDVEEWLYYINNCELFIGDSFHGLCFSIIFNKPFVIVLNTNVSGLCRFTTLLGMLGLEDRIYYENKPNAKTIDEILATPIDYDKVNKIIEEKAAQSYEWLKNAINSEKKNSDTITVLDKYSQNVADKNIKCSGCSACEAICPKNAIEMKVNERGFLNPVIDTTKCINCGLCIKKCTDINPQYLNTISPECYAVMASDEIRKISSSGGMFTIAAENVLEKGGYVCGAVYKDNFEVEHIIINDKSQLSRLRGSKYMQSNINGVFVEIKKLLDQGKIVLFTGLPCQVAGIYSYLGKKYDNLYTMELLCHGITSYKVFDKYHKDVLGNKKIERLEFKEKEPWGWCAGVNAYFDDGTKYSVRADKDVFFKAYLNSISKNDTCSVCKYNRLPRQADTTIGDFWGIGQYNKELNDGKGTSVVLVNTQKGHEFFKSLVPSMKMCEKLPLESSLKGNPVIRKPHPLHKNNDFFFKNIGKVNFDYLVESCFADDLYKIKQGLMFESIPKDRRDLFILAKSVAEKSNGRKIVTWAYGPIFAKILKEYFNLDVAFSVALNKNSINNTTILPMSALDNQRENYYVVALHPEYSANMIAELTGRGYKEIDDFIFRNHKLIQLTDLDLNKGKYEDCYGNVIEGSGIVGKILIRGFNNYVCIGKNNKNTNNISLCLASNANINVGDNITFNREFFVNLIGDGDYSLVIKDNCKFANSKIEMFGSQHECEIYINENCTFGRDFSASTSSGKKIIIGRDCMFSHEIILRSGDGHSIFDVTTGRNINSDFDNLDERQKRLVLGEHVWIGHGAMIMNGANVGNGSVIGARSFVKKSFPNNCSIAGMPARVIRKNIAWSRFDHSNDITRCGYKYIDYTEDEGSISVNDNKNVLVLGGTRFMGIRLVEKLLSKNYNVTIAVRGTRQDSFGDKVKRIYLDRLNEEVVAQKLKGKYYDIVIDNSAYCSLSVDNILKYLECGRYIQVSSVAVYPEEGKEKKSESDFPSCSEKYEISGQLNDYQKGKREAECIALQKFKEVSTAIARIPFVVEPDNMDVPELNSRLSSYVKALFKGTPLYVDDPDYICSFIRTDEEAEFLIHLAESDYSGVVNISSEGHITVREIMDYLEQKTGKKFVLSENGILHSFNRKHLKLNSSGFWFDLQVAKSIGYKPRKLSDWIYALLDKYIDEYN